MPNLNSISYDTSADLGDLGCGDLIIALAQAVQPLRAGQVIQIRATDSGAVEDIPAWCHMRGNILLASPTIQDPEHFYIQKGESKNG